MSWWEGKSFSTPFYEKKKIIIILKHEKYGPNESQLKKKEKRKYNLHLLTN